MLRSIFVGICVASLVLQLEVAGWAQRPSWTRTSSLLDRAGLVHVWEAQVQLDRSRSNASYSLIKVIGLDSVDSLNASAMRVFEVDFDGGQRRFAENDVDAAGNALGAAEASRLAEKAMIQLNARGLNPQLNERQIPAVELYVQSTTGMLHAIDAETGRTLWANTVGNPYHPSMTPAVNDQFVGVVNGSRLFILERKTGETIWEKDLEDNPMNGPTMGTEMVFVPTIRGEIEGFWLARSDEYSGVRPPWIYRSGDQITGPPTVTAQTVSWATEAGRMFVAATKGPEVLYRLETAGSLRSAPVAYGQNLYVSSVDGYVYAVEQSSGRFLWEVSLGEPISQAPLAANDRLYVVTDDDNLHCLTAAEGQKQWMIPGATQMISVGTDRVYAMDRIGQLMVLTAADGGLVTSVPIGKGFRPLTNRLTDRLYVMNSGGLVRCYRESGRRWPTVHPPLPQAEAAEAADAAAAAPAATSAPPAADSEPADDGFGGFEQDPFSTDPATPPAPLPADDAPAPEDDAPPADDDPFDFG